MCLISIPKTWSKLFALRSRASVISQYFKTGAQLGLIFEFTATIKIAATEKFMATYRIA